MHASNIELIHQPKRTNDECDSLCNQKLYDSNKPNVPKNIDNYKEPQRQNLLVKSANKDISKKKLWIS